MDCNNCKQPANCFNHNNGNMVRNGRYGRNNCSRMKPMPTANNGCNCSMEHQHNNHNNFVERTGNSCSCNFEQRMNMPNSFQATNDCGCNHFSSNYSTKMGENGCNIGNEPVDQMAPGMSFVPWQKWQDVYDIDQAINCGTIFKELYKPYVGRGCSK